VVCVLTRTGEVGSLSLNGHLRMVRAFLGRIVLLACVCVTPQILASDLGQSSQVFSVEEERIRLSQWLRQPRVSPSFQSSYQLGLTILSSEEALLQNVEREGLLKTLKTRSLQAASDPSGALRLYRMVESLPFLGRLALTSQDPYWLEFNPSNDPWLSKGDTVVVPQFSQEVAVVLGSGEACRVRYSSGLLAGDYVRACNERFTGSPVWLPFGSTEAYWLAQPDGHVFEVNESNWFANDGGPQDPPAPGAWIWAPGEKSAFSSTFSLNLARLLASQGPVGSHHNVLQKLPLVSTQPLAAPVPQHSLHSSSLVYSANDWGSLGYWQMPSARIQEGAIRFTYSRVQPAYKRYSLLLSPLPWMEFGFRYNRRMDPITGVYPDQFLDKNADAKFRLVQEGPYIPEISIGLLDGGGTGLFTSEYIVASKRWNDFDLSLGASFGYLAGSQGTTNPLSYVSSRFKTRQQTDTGLGGKPSPSSWFTGPMGLFAGVQWQTPYENLLFKAEFDSNNYKAEPTIGQLEQKSPINFGLVYRPVHWTEFSLGLERGNTVQLGLSLLLDASKPGPSKTLDTPVGVVYAQQAKAFEKAEKSPIASSGPLTLSQRLAQGVEQVTLWKVRHIDAVGEEVVFTFHSAQGNFDERLLRLNQYLHLALPLDVKTIRYRFVPFGLEVSEVVVDRKVLASSLNEYRSARRQAETSVSQAQPPSVPPGPLKSVAWTWGDFTVSPRLAYGQVFGTPEAFWMYHVSAAASTLWRFRDDTWLQGQVLHRLVDNLENMRGPDGTEVLPVVRSNAKAYFQGKNTTMSHLQLTHVGSLSRLGSSHYYSLYGGYFERMFGGVGAEYLYRPYGKALAFGVDMNYVGQREFEQGFGFQDYRVGTGHATLYWDTGYRGVRVKTLFGRYLAKDVGATLEISRTFENGFTMGAWATKTNVSAEEFGEGSFDKGIYFSFAFDAVIPKTTNLGIGFDWRPITRDGGAILGRRSSLYTITSQGRQALTNVELIGRD
jgi:hypothetical protein